MNTNTEWENERSWIDIENNDLYPPFQLLKKAEALNIIDGIDFKNKKVLDNGCGTGWFGEILKQRGAEVVGLDISDPLLEEARKRIKVVKGSSYALPFENNHFDVVVFFMVMHILDNPEKALSEMHRVLKPKGTLYIAIVHPRADKWDLSKFTSMKDFSTYNAIENRTWVFNLVNGGRFIKHYIHRPWGYYEKLLSDGFTIESKIEPKIPKAMSDSNDYAETEYLLLKLTKNKPGK